MLACRFCVSRKGGTGGGRTGGGETGGSGTGGGGTGEVGGLAAKGPWLGPDGPPLALTEWTGLENTTHTL